MNALAGDARLLRDFLIHLGEAMNAAGDAVSDVHARLERIARAYGAPQTRLAVSPTSVLVAIPGSNGADLAVSSEVNQTLRLDQTAAVFDLADRAETGRLDLAAGFHELGQIARMKPRFSAVTTVCGHAVLTVGLVLLLQPGWRDLIGGAVLGAGVGALKVWGPKGPALIGIRPVVAAFAVSLLAFTATAHGWTYSPLRLLIAPLITFLPGGALTTGTMDLSAGQMISGAGRLVQGGVQMVLLAFGIVAAAELVGLPSHQAFIDNPVNLMGPAAPWIGVLLFAVGLYINDSAAPGTLPWMLLVLYVAYSGQVIGGAVFGGYLSGFVGALLMTPVALFVAAQSASTPLMVTFMPAFWLLVPGAVGLLGVTQLLGAGGRGAGLEALLNATGTIVAIALGVLVGMSTRDAVARLARATHPSRLRLPW
jgi:uncharacterized membrane protein YjjP (DUF1212 family)